MYGDERDMKAAGEEAEYQKNVRRVAESFPECFAERLLLDRPGAHVHRWGCDDVLCQPISLSRPTASGENGNWPKEPEAVPSPNAKPRHCSGSSLPNAARTSVKLAPANPKPTSTPDDKCSIAGEIE